MGTCFLYGNGGGTKLPFRIFYGTTQPGNPKNYDIWIKTSVTVTNVDFHNGTWSSAAVGRTLIVGVSTVLNPSESNTINFVVSGKTNGIPTYGKLKLTGCLQVQGSAGNWVSLDAYRYYGGTWVQFSSAFSATINVTYPAGSTCTAKCGSYNNTAPNTTGKWACVVPVSGTWTISCTNGSSTDTETVSINTNGESKSVTLSYELVLYNAGNQCTSATGGWNGITKSTVAVLADSYINLTVGSDYAGNQAFTKSKVNTTNYDTLHVTVTNYSATCYMGISPSSLSTAASQSNWNSNKSTCTYIGTITKSGEVTLDISSSSGDFYIWLAKQGQDNSTRTGCYITKVWLT